MDLFKEFLQKHWPMGGRKEWTEADLRCAFETGYVTGTQKAPVAESSAEMCGSTSSIPIELIRTLYETYLERRHRANDGRDYAKALEMKGAELACETILLSCGETL